MLSSYVHFTRIYTHSRRLLSGASPLLKAPVLYTVCTLLADTVPCLIMDLFFSKFSSVESAATWSADQTTPCASLRIRMLYADTLRRWN